ncbi:hypothetical protein GCM10023223_48670 [Stackebrandtia albiflava]
MADAFRAVPRHVFAPNNPLAEVYSPRDPVITKRDANGVAISSVSAPEIQAFMLEQASIEPGMRVLEIGSGGFNAALASELVGESGHVTSIDIDDEVTARAAAMLKSAGFDHNVDVVCADATSWLPDDGSWDRIIVTVGAWDIPPLWTERLAANGRLVVPLRLRGITRSLALIPDNGHLAATSAEVCGFVQMQGRDAHEERLFLLQGKDIGLRFDDDNTPADMTALDGVLATERAVEWTDVTTRAGESFDSLELYLAARLPHFCLLTVAPGAGEQLVGHDEHRFRLAHVAGDSFAYLVSRRRADGLFAFGASAFGSNARVAAAQMVDQIEAWNALRPGKVDPAITVWPRPDSASELPEGHVIHKHHRNVVLSWT